MQNLPPPLDDYWLAFVTTVPVCPKNNTVIEGVALEGKKDAYLQVQYLVFSKVDSKISMCILILALQDTSAGGRVFVKEDIHPSSLFDCGAVIPYKVGSLPQGQQTITITPAVHQNILARL